MNLSIEPHISKLEDARYLLNWSFAGNAEGNLVRNCSCFVMNKCSQVMRNGSSLTSYIHFLCTCSSFCCFSTCFATLLTVRIYILPYFCPAYLCEAIQYEGFAAIGYFNNKNASHVLNHKDYRFKMTTTDASWP